MEALKRPKTQSERSAQTKQRLLEATLECVSENGFAATSTNDVVKRANVSRGALVHHYPTKEDLVAEAFAYLVRLRAEHSRKEFAKLDKGDQSLDTHVRLVHKVYDKWFPATMEFMMAARTDDALLKRFLSALQPFHADLVEQSFEEGQRFVGENDPVLIEYVVGCFVRGLCFEAIVNPPNLVEEILDRFIEILTVYSAKQPEKTS